MAMVGVDSDSLYRRTQPKSSGLVLGRRLLGAVLHASNDPGELFQWLCHNDSTINIVLDIIIILLLLYATPDITHRYRCEATASVNAGEQSTRVNCRRSSSAISAQLINTVSDDSFCAAESSWSESASSLSRPQYFFFVALVFTSRPWKPPPLFPPVKHYTNPLMTLLTHLHTSTFKHDVIILS